MVKFVKIIGFDVEFGKQVGSLRNYDRYNRAKGFCWT